MSRAARAPLRGILLVLLLLLAAGGLRGQGPASASEPEPGSELAVYLVTMGPGELVWERFGHNALWIHDELRGTDVAYNYGIFDFAQENFLLRFVQGRMLYWMEPMDAERMIQAYLHADRSVWVQELNLTPRERGELRAFLEWNALPENREYRYDYYRDNCSTRVRDALDRVLGGQLRAQTEDDPSGTTYRWHTRRLTTADVPTYTGLQLGLAQAVDQPISDWEEMFLPLKLRDHVERATVARDGREEPLVKSARALYLSSGIEVRDEPPSWTLGYLAVGVGLGVLLLGLAWLASRSSGAAQIAFAAIGSLWSVVIGVGGLVLLGLWAFTDHTAAYRNENLFHFDPLALPLVLLVPLLPHRSARVRRAAFALSAAVAAISVLGLVLKVLPGLYQVNGEVIALVLPVHLALAAGVYLLTRARPEAPAPVPAPAEPPVHVAGKGRRA